jgi:hypothetical protein
VLAHIARLVRACWTLGGEPALTGLRLRQRAHMLGFGGHWSTKSRRYSTTLTALRRARAAHAEAQRRNGAVPLDAWQRPMTDLAVVVVKEWAMPAPATAPWATPGWPPRPPPEPASDAASPAKS